MDTVKIIGLETIKSKKGEIYYKVYAGCLDKNTEGYKVKDYFLTWKPDVTIGDDYEIVFGAGYDMKAYLKDFKKV